MARGCRISRSTQSANWLQLGQIRRKTKKSFCSSYLEQIRLDWIVLMLLGWRQSENRLWFCWILMLHLAKYEERKRLMSVQASFIAKWREEFNTSPKSIDILLKLIWILFSSTLRGLILCVQLVCNYVESDSVSFITLKEVNSCWAADEL